MLFTNVPLLLTALAVAVSAHPSTSTDAIPLQKRGTDSSMCEAAIPSVDISGEYVCTKYGANANDYHFVMVTGEGSAYRWSNHAGVSWSLNLARGTKDLFTVGKECPYYNDGYRSAKVESRMAPGGVKQVTAIYGPGDELYTLKSLVDPWNPVFCPSGSVDATCWADTAYQKCASARQAAYDAIMAEKAGGQEAMYYKYLCVIASC